MKSIRISRFVTLMMLFLAFRAVEPRAAAAQNAVQSQTKTVTMTFNSPVAESLSVTVSPSTLPVLLSNMGASITNWQSSGGLNAANFTWSVSGFVQTTRAASLVIGLAQTYALGQSPASADNIPVSNLYINATGSVPSGATGCSAGVSPAGDPATCVSSPLTVNASTGAVTGGATGTLWLPVTQTQFNNLSPGVLTGTLNFTAIAN